MSKFLKVLVGSVVVGAVAVGVAATVKAVCDNRKKKYVPFNDIEDFVVYVTTPEDVDNGSTKD